MGVEALESEAVRPADLGPIAIVDDDPTLRRFMRLWLEADGYRTVEYAHGRDAIEATDGRSLVCLDLGLDDMPGLHVIEHLRDRDPDLPIIVVTARADLETAVEAMRAGADDYLAKPLEHARVSAAVRRVVGRSRVAEAVRRQRLSASQETTLGSLVGASPAMREMARQVERVLDSDVSVCLFGESGSGKELVARAIHDHGQRRRGPFVALNCAAIAPSLQESELFGHERGAFTGAAGTHKGRFEQAQNGTLFLDELGEMSLSTQATLLRTLQERTIRRVGGTTEIPVNVRVVCATHRDLAVEVKEGRFREDLYFRLVVYPIQIPPLRARKDDIPRLAGHFLHRLRGDVGREITRVSPEALECLSQHEWPGNVREFQNVMHRAMLACDGDVILPAHLPPDLRARRLPSLPATPTPGGRTTGPTLHFDEQGSEVTPLNEIERRAILHALRVAGGSVAKAAKLLGIGRATLYRRLTELDVRTAVE